MMRIIEQTDAEKRAMYMRCTKADLVTMLMNNQELAEKYLELQRNGPEDSWQRLGNVAARVIENAAKYNRATSVSDSRK